MKKYNPLIHHRRSIRLKGYDYSKPGLYFITLCCENRQCIFGQIENGKMRLNTFGQIAYNEWMKTPEIRPNIELGEFIVMPNHIHGIIRILDVDRRGELHSPINHTVNSPINHTVNSPINQTVNSPQIQTGNLSQIPNVNLSQPEILRKGEFNFKRGEFDSPQREIAENGEFDSEKIELDLEKGEFNFKRGEFDSPQRDKTGKGEFKSPQRTVGAIIRGYKSSVTKQINESGSTNIPKKIWQRDYYEHIIRTELSHDRISNYIINNPAKWSEDKFRTR